MEAGVLILFAILVGIILVCGIVFFRLRDVPLQDDDSRYW
jgi:hypothetical protein